MKENNSIFELADKFDFKSPLGNWQKKMADKKEEEKLKILAQFKVTKVEGPYNDKGQIVKYISRKHSYFYLATINQPLTSDIVKNINWAVSYDGESTDKSFYLFSGGELEKGKIKVNIQISKGKEKFTIYAYKGDLPNSLVAVEVQFKQAIVFFIGGAGDKSPYLGRGPTNIVLNEIKIPFDNNTSPKESVKSKYLGFEDAYKNKIATEVISFIPNKDGTSINIIGHSLGGWNGAHLSEVLATKGYNIDLLVTLDPVGKGPIVNAISDIYWAKPSPKSKWWINIYANSDDYEGDDFVADLGVQWLPPKKSVDIFHDINLHHREAGKMFKDIIQAGISSSDFLLHFINLYLDTK